MAFDRTFIQVRERTFLDLLDLAIVVLRSRPVTLGLTALLGICPFLALNAWVLFPHFADTSENDWRSLLIVAFEVPFATAPLTIVLGRLMFVERIRPTAVVVSLLTSIPELILYQFLLRGICFFPLLLPVLPTKLGFVSEVVLLERGSWYKVVNRSAALAGGRGGQLFLYWIVVGFYLSVFTLAFAIGGSQIIEQLLDTGDLMETDERFWVDPLLQTGLWIGISLLTIYRFLLYIDQRIRLEGWQVELRLRSVGASLEDNDRW